MNTTFAGSRTTRHADDSQLATRSAPVSPAAPAASWPAIVAGAVAAAAMSMILLVLGSGLGLAVISPGGAGGASADALSVGSVVWLILMSALASGLGGYLAGRLRTRWTGADPDEVYFRDTAHGFLTWALSTLISAVLLTSIVSSIIANATRAGAEAVSTWSATAGVSPDEYYVDKLLRNSTPGASDEDYSLHMEVGQILAVAIGRGELAAEDRSYLVALVANVADIDSAQAEQRITQVMNDATMASQQLESIAGEATDSVSAQFAKLSLWVFVALLVGAFSGSFAATLGGRQRDRITAG